MRLRSTGLGKSELKAEPTDLEPVGHLLILHVQTTEPVRWHIRVGLQRRDVFRLFKLLFSFRIIKYLLRLPKAGDSEEPANF